MKITTGFALVLASLVAVQGARIVSDSGMLRSITPLEVSQCELLLGPTGAEDMTIDRSTHVVYISADDRRNYLIHGDHGATNNGGLWLLDLKQQDSQPKQLQTGMDGPFHPHGIALRHGPVPELIP